ncbi:MAG: hypothetical protein NZ562_08340 [Thermomicrobium sp.]|nr:hypothetical protein [Thermomicrobium sp.]
MPQDGHLAEQRSGAEACEDEFFPLWAETGDLDLPLFAEEETLGW